MDKNDSVPKRLVRPTAKARTQAAGAVNSEPTKNGSASASVTALTGEIVRKISLTAPISPINANRPGRLASFRGERDLTLGSSKQTGADAGAKPKKVFTPTIPSRRSKAQEPSSTIDSKTPDSFTNSRGRGRRDGAPRGRGRGKPELVQTTGSIFGEGISGLSQKQRTTASYADREDSSGPTTLEKPKLSTLDTRINKEEEDAALKELLRDDFITYDGDGYDPDLLMQPIQLPKSSFVKSETETDDMKNEPSPVVTVDGVTIKQEKDDTKPVIATKNYQRRINPLEVTSEQIFQNDGDILFFQLPDVLPCLKVDKDRAVIKVEPGVTPQNTEGNTSTEKAETENVFENIKEGRLGTLRIHKSGKITLQMGDHSFVVDSATQVSYLQDLVSVDVNTQEKTGTMKALGSIRYKAVCLPNWDELINDA